MKMILKNMFRRIGVWWTGDPLYGFEFAARFQTHDGDGKPKGMWKDEECREPAVNDGDPVACWMNKATGKPERMPHGAYLKFSNGIPGVVGAGIRLSILLLACSWCRPW